MWAKLLNGQVIGPYILPPNLTGDTYLIFREYKMYGILEDGHQNMWFRHDGTAPHFTLAVQGHLGQLLDNTG